MNVKKGNIIKALDYLLLHLIDCCCVPCHTEMELHYPPILFNKIEFTVIFWIEITQMAMQFN